MKRVSLKQVVQRCVREPNFFRALLRDPEKALARARLQISGKDLRKLKRLTRDKSAMKDFAVYGKLMRKYVHTPQGILW
jgi:hypothetical protein